MSSGLETAQTVAALLISFHSAASTMKRIVDKTKKRKTEEGMKQKWLLETLEAGEVQISQRYGQYLAELGDRFRMGDATSRDKIQHIVIVMQSELLRPLQLFLEHHKTTALNVDKFQGDVFMYRRDVLSAFDELRDRMKQHVPAQPTAIGISQLVPTHHPDSISSPTAPVTSRSNVSAASSSVTEEDDGGRRMSRLFSMRSKPHKRSSTSGSTIANMVIAPSLNWLGPVQAEPKTYELPAADVQRPQQPSPGYDPIKLVMPEPDTAALHPVFANQNSANRPASTSTYSSDYSYRNRGSTFSDEKIAVLDEEDDLGSPFPDVSALAAAMPPGLPQPLHPAPLNVRPRQHRVSFTPPDAQAGAPFLSPQDEASPPTGLTPDYFPRSLSYPNQPAPSPPPNPPLTPRDRSNTALSGFSTPSSHQDSSIRSPSLASNPLTTTTGPPLVGRPEKKNNYWGFCKGAWTIREDWRRGLVMQTIPAGMFGTSQVWQCKSCCFRGGIYGQHKPYGTDPNVHEDAGTGVRYRWIFLAKCHTKVGQVQRAGEAGYACLLCSLGNMPSAIYGSEATLFRHVVEQHAEGMSESMAQRARCVVGYKAAAREEFDINIL